MDIKTCGKCKETKSLEDFNIDRAMKDGRLGQCRVCINAYRAMRRRLNGAVRITKYPQYIVDMGAKMVADGVQKRDIQKHFDELGETVNVASLLGRIRLEKKGVSYITDAAVLAKTDNKNKSQWDLLLYNPRLSYVS